MSHITLPPLPWASNALEPTISRRTLETHHGKHHKKYVDTTNELIAGTDLDKLSLDDIVRETAASRNQRKLFNNAAQAWNHARYWESLSPNGGAPEGELAEMIARDLGGVEKLKDDMVKLGVAHFASGWVWLTWRDNKLNLIDTHDADNALAKGHKALLVLDLWEHAYYLDYQQDREKHLRAVVEDVLNWRGASERFAELSCAVGPAAAQKRHIAFQFWTAGSSTRRNLRNRGALERLRSRGVTGVP